jgi:hypothetical protein
MALWAWRYTSQDDGGDACGSGDCFAILESLASCAGIPPLVALRWHRMSNQPMTSDELPAG